MPHSVIAVIASLDTKSGETDLVAKAIRNNGHNPLLIDVGLRGVPLIKPGISREEVAKASGSTLAQLSGLNDRAKAISTMSRGLSAVLTLLHRESHDFKGVLGLGGGC